MGLITKLFGTRSQRELKKIQPTVDAILALESEYKAMSEEALKAKTEEFKQRYQNGESLDASAARGLCGHPGGGGPGASACGPIPCSSSAALFCIRVVLPR